MCLDAYSENEREILRFVQLVPQRTMKTIASCGIRLRGDAAPYAGLGIGLRLAGYRVVVAAMASQASLGTDAGPEQRAPPARRRGRAAQRLEPAALDYGEKTVPVKSPWRRSSWANAAPSVCPTSAAGSGRSRST